MQMLIHQFPFCQLNQWKELFSISSSLISLFHSLSRKAHREVKNYISMIVICRHFFYLFFFIRYRRRTFIAAWKVEGEIFWYQQVGTICMTIFIGCWFQYQLFLWRANDGAWEESTMNKMGIYIATSKPTEKLIRARYRLLQRTLTFLEAITREGFNYLGF